MALVAQWMWGDASLVGHTVAELNPLRWSSKKCVEETITELKQHSLLQETPRPVQLRISQTVLRDGASVASPMSVKQDFKTIEDAVNRLRELASHAGLEPEVSDVAQPTIEESHASNGSSPARTRTSQDLSSVAATTGSPPKATSSTAVDGSLPDVNTADGVIVTGGIDTRPLGGMLEKRSLWRKEWRFRFFVMRRDRIDYFNTMPDMIDEAETSESCKSLRLSPAEPAEEPGRPHCIRMGSELLSCRDPAEQQKWLQRINSACNASRSRALSIEAHEDLSTGEAWQLLLVKPSGECRPVAWREPQLVALPNETSSVTILLAEPASASAITESSPIQFQRSFSSDSAFAPAGGAMAQAMCQFRPFEMHGRECVLAVQEMAGLVASTSTPSASSLSGMGLRICLQSKEVKAAEVVLVHKLCVAFAFVAFLMTAAGVNMMLVLVAIVLTLLLVVYSPEAEPPRRSVTFSAERLEPNASTILPQSTLAPLGDEQPRWCGRWVLDKACSESYDPILQDLGVAWVLRKAADAARSVMTIWVTSTHVTIHLKLWVSVEDCIPLDGTSTEKPVPPGSKMTGMCTVRLTKCTPTELEMFTVFPDGNGEMRDTLTVADDGASFKRVVVKGSLSVTRVFRKEDHM